MVDVSSPNFSQVEERSKQPPRREPPQTEKGNTQTQPSVQPKIETIIKRSKDN